MGCKYKEAEKRLIVLMRKLNLPGNLIAYHVESLSEVASTFRGGQDSGTSTNHYSNEVIKNLMNVVLASQDFIADMEVTIMEAEEFKEFMTDLLSMAFQNGSASMGTFNTVTSILDELVGNNDNVVLKDIIDSISNLVNSSGLRETGKSWQSETFKAGEKNTHHYSEEVIDNLKLVVSNTKDIMNAMEIESASVDEFMEASIDQLLMGKLRTGKISEDTVSEITDILNTILKGKNSAILKDVISVLESVMESSSANSSPDKTMTSQDPVTTLISVLDVTEDEANALIAAGLSTLDDVYSASRNVIEKVMGEVYKEGWTNLDRAAAIKTKIEDYFGPVMYQHNPLLKNVDDALLETIKQRLATQYPEIQVETVDRVIDSNGIDAVGMAINGVVKYVPGKAGLDTLPHEYAHIYIDMLEKTTYVDKLLTLISRNEGLNRYEAKEFLVEQMGVNYANWVRDGKPNSVSMSRLERVWQMIKDFFTGKDILKAMDAIQKVSENFYNGVNKDAISMTPKNGYVKINPERTFEAQPFAADILKNLTDFGKGKIALTGSMALAMKGNIYRKGLDGITDLHDLDFIVPDRDTLYEAKDYLENNYSVTPIYKMYVRRDPKDYSKGENLISTSIVVPKGHSVKNLKRFNDQTWTRVVSYEIVKDDTGDVVGTYKAEVRNKEGNPNASEIIRESFGTGIRAAVVDLIESKESIDTQIYRSKVLNGSIAVVKPSTVFDAKNGLQDIPRDKDLGDFRDFYREKIETAKYKEVNDNLLGKIVVVNTPYNIAPNENIVDGNAILNKELSVEGKGTEEHAINRAIREIKAIAESGKTVVIASDNPKFVNAADLIAVQKDPYVVQSNANKNGGALSLQDAKKSIVLYNRAVKDKDSIELTYDMSVNDVLYKEPELDPYSEIFNVLYKNECK